MPQYYILYKKTLSIKAQNSLILRLVLAQLNIVIFLLFINYKVAHVWYPSNARQFIAVSKIVERWQLKIDVREF